VPDYGKTVKFAFDADTWSTSIHHTIGLTEVFRQRDPGRSLHDSLATCKANLCSIRQYAQRDALG
jgi:hypothetical protein